jgi:hypothetical protein
MTKLEARIPIEARMPGNGELGHSDFNRHSGFELRTLHNRGLLLVACGLWLLLAACEVTPSEQFTPQLVVHGQLQVGNTGSLYVQVNRTYRIGDSYDWRFGDPSIVVFHGRDSVRPRSQDGDEHGLFYPVLDVHPGDTFEIMVAESLFDTVRGRTVVPDTFHMLYPNDGDTVTLYDSLGWTRSRTAAGYYFSIPREVNGEMTWYDIVIANDSVGSDYDSTKVHIPSMFFYYGDSSGWKTLTVYAVDSNYYDWMRLVGYGAGGGTPPETTRLTGGLGVFGSSAVGTLRIYLTADTTFGAEPQSEFRGQNAEFRMPESNGWGERTGRTDRQGPSRRSQNSDIRMQKSEVSADVPSGTLVTR